MSAHLEGVMEKATLLEGSSRMPFYTDLQTVFKAFGRRQVEFNWLLTNLECNYYPPEFQSDLQPAHQIWLSGEKLTRLVEQYDIQFVWAVLSGFDPQVIIDLDHLEVMPYADGNKILWTSSAKIQHPLAKVELVCWDSSATLLLSRDEDLTKRFQIFFPEAVDLYVYNQHRAIH